MKFVLSVLACFTALFGWGSPAAGGLFSENHDPLWPIERRPPFFLAAAVGAKAGFVPSTSFSLQQQPFPEAPVQLRDDDPAHNRKSGPWPVALGVVSTNALVWAVDRFVLNNSWSHVGLRSWKSNFESGWEWDIDRLGTNFFLHPLAGGALFNSARANGYGFLESVPFVFLGSLMWEYLGETTRPAYNDLINTTFSGALFGEMLYRLSSNLLDDRTRGAERFFRELGAAVLSPGRALNRLVQGKLTRVTPREVYQKEPLNLAWATGTHWFNKGTKFGTGSLSAILNIHLDYGDPFDIRPRKPFDVFTLRLDLSYGKNVGKKFLDNAIGYGLLFGETVHSGNLEMLIGAFQHYNYWQSKIFEISALSFGGGIVAKWRLSGKSNLQSAFHLGIVPLGASNSPYIDIMDAGVPGRNYDYSGGGEAKFEGTLNLSDLGQVTLIYYLYRLHAYVGPAGYKTMGILKPRLAVRLLGNLSLGFEYLYYHKDSILRDYPDVHKRGSEQKLYLMLYF